MVGCVEGILGMRPVFDGLRIAPAIPAEWDGFTAEKVFRGKRLHITVTNPRHVQSGCTVLRVNGKTVEGDLVPEALMTADTVVELEL